MKSTLLFAVFAAYLLSFLSCELTPPPAPAPPPPVEPAKPNIPQIRAEIQAMEDAFATAWNARDAAAVVKYYSDDAMSLHNNAPMSTGKAAIQAQITKDLAEAPKGMTLDFEIVDVLAEGNLVIETGKATAKDASGKVASTGKYISVFEKRNGKYVCIRDINNEDKK